MQHLLGRLSATDPGAGEALRIVAYFDVLFARGAGIDGLVRGAAMLSGAIAGAEIRGQITRRDADGNLLEATGDVRHSSERSGDGWRVWLERKGPVDPNDGILIERLALGVELLEAKRLPESALEILIDGARTPDERAEAVARLQLDRSSRIRLFATRPDAPALRGPSTVVPTRYGLAKATLGRTGADMPAGPEPAGPERIGIGPWVDADHAPDSWSAAVVGLQLTDASHPVVDGAGLGAMLILATSYDPEHPHPDVVALSRLDARTHEILLALVEAESVRAAATALGMHHSTLQLRHHALTDQLGYDPRSNLGRMRYIAANLLRRLTEPLA